MERVFALLLIAIGAIGMLVWLKTAGMSLMAATAWIAVFLLGAIVMTRSVAESGLFTTQVLAQPGATLAGSLGMAQTLGPGNLSVMAFQDYANGADWGRGLIMPNIMQSLKLSLDRQWPIGRVLVCLCLVLALAIPISCYATLSLFYERGAANSSGGLSGWYFQAGNVNALKDPAGWLQFPPEPGVKHFNRAGFAFFAAGTVAIVFLRSLFYWLPFHPLGFVLCGGYAVMRMFPSVLVGWALKVAIMRYGGGRAYSTLRPLFIGLILGDFLYMAIWGLVNFLANKSGYSPAIF